ncbi:MAG: CsbD family protein [Anaerolineaceae bacterium]|nr:CsbD family protein [Anaerolineaceae bacterium]
MNEDVLKGQWKQIRGNAKAWWGKLTDDDLDVIDGKRDQLIGKLQEKYGFTKDQAAQEVNSRMKELDRKSEVKHQA